MLPAKVATSIAPLFALLVIVEPVLPPGEPTPLTFRSPVGCTSAMSPEVLLVAVKPTPLVCVCTAIGL